MPAMEVLDIVPPLHVLNNVVGRLAFGKGQGNDESPPDDSPCPVKDAQNVTL